jgi:hypothetical protein
MPETEISKGVSSIIDIEGFKNDVQIDENLDKAYKEQAATFAYYATKAFEAQRQAAAKKLMMSITEAKLDRKLREDAIHAAAEGEESDAKLKAGKGKLTEKQIEQAIARDPAYVAAQIAFNDASAVASMCNNALEALRQRRDMIIGLGASAREEMKGALALKN